MGQPVDHRPPPPRSGGRTVDGSDRPTHDARRWTFDLDPGGRDPVLGIERLQEAYFARFAGYDRGVTVPAIVDIPTGQVVTNDYSQITLDLSTQWRAHKLTEMPMLWAYARDLFCTPGFGDTIDFDHIKRHYYQAHRDINPTGIVPAGPDPTGWLRPHGRDWLGGRPFGNGTPPSARE